MALGDDGKKRTTISKTEWHTIKTQHKNRCCVCEKTEKSVDVLEKAHVKALKRRHTIFPKVFLRSLVRDSK